MIRRPYLLLLFLTTGADFFAESIEWQATFGGSQDEVMTAMVQTSDGGFAAAGYTNSADHGIQNKGFHDGLVVKFNKTGQVEWHHTFGGSGSDVTRSMEQTRDSGFILAGYTGSTDGDIDSIKGSLDIWVVKLDKQGNLQWLKTFGGSEQEDAYSVCQTSDGGYFITGTSQSFDGDVTRQKSDRWQDCWLLKLNGSGLPEWQKVLDGTYMFYDGRQTREGGYILAGTTSGTTISDYAVINLTPTGDVKWLEIFGPGTYSFASNILQTQDQGYIMIGSETVMTHPAPGQATGFYNSGLYKLDINGKVLWQQSFGGEQSDAFLFISPTEDDGFITAGYNKSGKDNANNLHGFSAYWILKLTKEGVVQWETTVGGSQPDSAQAIFQTPDGGYIVGGSSKSGDGDVTNLRGGSDFWIVKLTAK